MKKLMLLFLSVLSVSLIAMQGDQNVAEQNNNALVPGYELKRPWEIVALVVVDEALSSAGVSPFVRILIILSLAAVAEYETAAQQEQRRLQAMDRARENGVVFLTDMLEQRIRQ